MPSRLEHNTPEDIIESEIDPVVQLNVRFLLKKGMQDYLTNGAALTSENWHPGVVVDFLIDVRSGRLLEFGDDAYDAWERNGAMIKMEGEEYDAAFVKLFFKKEIERVVGDNKASLVNHSLHISADNPKLAILDHFARRTLEQTIVAYNRQSGSY